MRYAVGILGDSDQYELDLFPELPWNGRSPRGLTKAVSVLFLRPEPPGHEVEADPMQLDFFHSQRRATKRNRAPGKQPGAPLLLPLKPGKMSRARSGPHTGDDHGETTQW